MEGIILIIITVFLPLKVDLCVLPDTELQT